MGKSKDKGKESKGKGKAGGPPIKGTTKGGGGGYQDRSMSPSHPKGGSAPTKNR